jgi:serine/threonine-protein kinase
VYRAEHPQHGVCAFKVLRPRLEGDPIAVARFLREAGYGVRVRHPGVVRTYDYGEAEGVHYLALEWAEGGSLATFLHRQAPLAPERVAPLVQQLADALAAAHDAGIIHRDLKPANIMFDERGGTTKLLDFGIARDADLAPEDRLTRTGYFVGSLPYVAPEALSGALVDPRADIYNLATIAYYMLSGRHPFPGRSPRELFQQLLTRDPTPLRAAAPERRLPAGLEAVVMRGLARDPAHRQADVRQFAREFAAAAAGGPSGGVGLLAAIKHMIRPLASW